MLLQAHSIRKECDPMAVNESAENYLETILVLSKTHPVVRSVDIAEELGFKKSSVSVAMKNLREKEPYYRNQRRVYLSDRYRPPDC